MNQNITGHPLDYYFHSHGPAGNFVWSTDKKIKLNKKTNKKNQNIFLCPQIRWKNNEKRLKAVMKNLLILIFCTPPFSPSLFFSILGWEEIVFRIEFIIWDSFSARGHWFGRVDSRPLPSTLGINRSYRRRQMPQFFIKACSQCCSDERQLQSFMGADSLKITWQAGYKMEIQPGIKNWWWWWSQFLRGNKPHGAPALYTHINLYTLLILNPQTGSQRITQYYTDGSSNLHVLLHQGRLILWSSYRERQSYWFFLNGETETFFPTFFDTTYISETLTKGRVDWERKRSKTERQG